MCPRRRYDPSRRVQAADGAIGVIAAGGLRRLTHRAVDEYADLPPGTTSTCFRTRQDLVSGTLARIVELDERVLEAMPPGWWHDPQTALDALTAMLTRWIGPERERVRARMELYLVAAGDPHLRPELEAATRRFVQRAETGLREVGARRPDHAARLFVALLDGILFDALVRGPVDEDWVRDAVASVLTAMAAELRT